LGSLISQQSAFSGNFNSQLLTRAKAEASCKETANHLDQIKSSKFRTNELNTKSDIGFSRMETS